MAQMSDNDIIDLLFARSESALDEVKSGYGRLYRHILSRTVGDTGEVDECENDVLLAIWNSIPPNRPRNMAAYICAIARRVGIDRLRYRTSAKRSSEYTVTIAELSDTLPDEDSLEQSLRSEQIRDVLKAFLRRLDPVSEVLFLRRYIYLETVSELSRRFELEENTVSVKLYRARGKLRRMLEQEGITV